MAALLLASPTVLAFRAGGFFPETVLWAGIAAALVAAVVALSPLPLPGTRAGRVCLAALAGLTGWIALSIAWSPLKDQALRDAERSALYLALLFGAIVVLRDRRVLRAVEPALAAGAFVVGCYALATRLLPGVVDATRSATAGARLEQPLTYWNGLGLLMALSLVLVVGLAGDRSRSAGVRIAASAAGPPLLLALYLTLSRGAVVAVVVGAAVLLAASRRRSVLDAGIAIALVGGGLVAAAARFQAVDSLAGDDADLRRQGAVVLVLTVAAAVASGFGAAGLMRLERTPATWTGWLARRPRVAVGAAALVLVAAAVIAFGPRPQVDAPAAPSTPAPAPRSGVGTDPSRLRTLESDRYEYWRAAAGELTTQPIRGLGAGGFGPVWLRERDEPVRARDAHSLYLETALELGLVGLALLAALLAPVARVAVRRARAHPGLVAVVATWAVHASWDWDWEMPAVTIPFLIAAGALIAADEEGDT